MFLTFSLFSIWRWTLFCTLCSYFQISKAETMYTIVGLSIGPVSTFLSDFKPMFEGYLTQAVSAAINRTVGFKLQAVSLNAEKDSIFDIVESKRSDFIYSSPNVYACLESEFGIRPLATVRKKYKIRDRMYVLNR